MLHTNTQKYYTPNSGKYIFYIAKLGSDALASPFDEAKAIRG